MGASPIVLIHEDDDLIVVDKAAGIEVDNESVSRPTNILNVIPRSFPALSSVPITLVHRIDKYTSGLVVLAKTAAAGASLEKQFRTRTVEKEYHAIVQGRVARDTGVMAGPIGRDPKMPKRFAVIRGGKPAFSAYTVLSRLTGHTLLALFPKTGRTHQLRVHCAQMGHPIIGDRLYSKRAGDYAMKGFALIAKKITFDHPSTGKRVSFETEYPDEFKRMCAFFSVSSRP
ncbi:MAG: RluA family pseudouridine synthase [Spirochaetota bacterium]